MWTELCAVVHSMSTEIFSIRDLRYSSFLMQETACESCLRKGGGGVGVVSSGILRGSFVMLGL